MEIILDVKEFKGKKKAHNYLKKVLKFPDYYGKNLDALYDCLGEIGEETLITVPKAIQEKGYLGEYGKTMLQVFLDAAKGYESEPEGGLRCVKCFELRLAESARLAKELNCEYFTTTLTISPMKNAQVLNEVVQEQCDIYGIKRLPSDFKKKGGYKRSIQLSAEYNLYRQNYCGCAYSKRDAEKREESR